MAKNPHAQALGKLGGSVKSARKTAAVRENGKKGGRPKRILEIRQQEKALHHPASVDVSGQVKTLTKHMDREAVLYGVSSAVSAAAKNGTLVIRKGGFWTRYTQKDKP